MVPNTESNRKLSENYQKKNKTYRQQSTRDYDEIVIFESLEIITKCIISGAGLGLQLKASVEEEVNVHRSEIEKNAFKVFKLKKLVSCLILTLFSQEKDRPLSLVFYAESSYIFLYCFYFVINYKNVHKLLNAKTGASCAILQFDKKKAEKGCPV